MAAGFAAVEGTKSTDVLPPISFSASFSFANLSRLFRNLLLNAHSGKALGFHRSGGNVVEYWVCSSISTKVMSLSIKLGFLRAVECSSLALKWMPFFFNSRNWSNFLLAPGGGEPGGEGGMSMLGAAGSVRSRKRARFAEYGEEGLPVVSWSSMMGSSTGGSEGPKRTELCCTGPIVTESSSFVLEAAC